MKTRLAGLLLLVAALLLLYQLRLHPAGDAGLPVAPDAPPGEKILLVPLDGRPPCRQFVVDAGRIAGLEVVVPPSRLQDYYTMAGDTEGMRAWARTELPHARAAILSIDQLLYGGLLAAREKSLAAGDIDRLEAFLRELHAACPGTPLYAFCVLPRLTPQDSIDGYEERRDLMAYARLVGRRAAGLPASREEIERLAARIPPKSMEAYLRHFEESRALGERLAGLAAEGVLERLVLGQDDGEPYSIPNIEKERLRLFLAQRGIPEERVFLAHGADEIALDLLAEIKCRETGYRPSVHVAYGDSGAAGRVMPFMAVSMEAVAAEKLRMLHAKRLPVAEEADCTLFVFAGGDGSLAARARAAQEVERMAEAGQAVALVDLSQHFLAEETLLPLLVRRQAPVNALVAYAGWNTASNSVGTALAQAVLFLAARREAGTRSEALALCRRNLCFLQSRCLEDSLYLKDVIDRVNASLRGAGYANTADLDLSRNWRWANAMLQDAMGRRIAAWRESAAFRAPFRISVPGGTAWVRARNLVADMGYPWPRTFEISLRASVELEEVTPPR